MTDSAPQDLELDDLARERIRRIEEIEADMGESDDPVGELLMWAKNRSSHVRGQAYRAVADHWEDPRMIPFLLGAIDHEKDPGARGMACIGLGRFLDAASDEGVIDPNYTPDHYTADPFRTPDLTREVYDTILALARGAPAKDGQAGDTESEEVDIEVRRRALESLGSFAYRSEVGDVIEALYTREEEEAQISAIFTMGRSGLKQYRKRLLKHLDDQRPAVQYEAIQAVEWWELRAALPYLRRITLDPSNPNRGDALVAFARFGPTAKLRSLLIGVKKMLPDPMLDQVLPDVQEQVLDDLEIGTRDDDDPVGDLFPDED